MRCRLLPALWMVGPMCVCRPAVGALPAASLSIRGSSTASSDTPSRWLWLSSRSPGLRGTRYYVPPGMLAAVLRAADPVVTSNGDRLRFESFSACCGVYARLDVLPGVPDAPAFDTGTTNVDFNPPMREALAGIAGLDPLHLSVGQDVIVTTLDVSVTERKVPLPDRWVKGFAEVQIAAAGMQLAFEIPVVEARRFIRSLPAASGTRTAPMWAVPAGRGLRLTGRAGGGAVRVGGTLSGSGFSNRFCGSGARSVRTAPMPAVDRWQASGSSSWTTLASSSR